MGFQINQWDAFRVELDRRLTRPSLQEIQSAMEQHTTGSTQTQASPYQRETQAEVEDIDT